MFFERSSVNFADIIDGTSNTLLASESIRRGSTTTGWGGAGAYWGGARWGGYGFTAEEPPNTAVPDQIYQCKSTTFIGAPCTSLMGANTTRNYARSYHPGGVMAGIADGSVRFVSETIDLVTYYAVSTRRGGEAQSFRD
jgi:hypothetical protein